jgi:hypothetical protein
LAVAVVAAALAADAQGQARAACTHADRALDGFASLTTYDDPIQDSGAAPDFCAGEMVTNDNEDVTFGIHAHNRDSVRNGDSYSVYLDTDLNPDTGGGVGAEYELTLTIDGVALNRWNGTAFEPVPDSTASVRWQDGYGPVLEVPIEEIGNPAGFNFVLASANGADADRAPDAGSWSYTLTPLALEAGRLSLGSVRAGRAFTARMLVVRGDLNVPLTEGAIACRAKVAGRRLAGTGEFAGDGVACTWRVPKNAHGKRLTGSVSVRFQGATASRSFSLRVA